MSNINKKRASFGFVISEGNGTISRGFQAVDLGAGADAGTPLGRITETNVLVPWNSAATDGSQVIDCILGQYGAGVGRAVTVGRGAIVNVDDLVFDEADYDDLIIGLTGIGVFGVIGGVPAVVPPVDPPAVDESFPDAIYDTAYSAAVPVETADPAPTITGVPAGLTASIVDGTLVLTGVPT